MKIFFVDTNIFLQCKSLYELPWNEISDGKDILLLIARPVLEEIDLLKHDGSSRRAKRARKANSFIREIILSEDSRKIIRKSEPRVEISFSPPPMHSKSDILGLTCNDNRIINEALSYLAANPDSDVALLTHDTNPLLTAKHRGLAYTVIPDEWLLLPEPDVRDKKILEIERKLKELEKHHPKIEVTIKGTDDNPITSLSLNVTTYDDLSEQKLEKLVTQVKETNPLVTEFGNLKKHYPPLLFGLHFEPPSEKEIKEYREKKYQKWLEDVKSFFNRLPRELELPTRHITFSFVLANSGIVPAENVVVEFHALGGLLFKPPESNDETIGKAFEIKFPPPPAPPKGKWVHFGEVINGIASLQMTEPFSQRNSPPLFLPSKPRPRDRNAFYWKDGRPDNYNSIWTFECEEFRHQVHEEIFELNLFIPHKNNISKGAVNCVLTAKNLPNPIKVTLPIRIDFNKGDVETETQNILEHSQPNMAVAYGY